MKSIPFNSQVRTRAWSTKEGRMRDFQPETQARFTYLLRRTLKEEYWGRDGREKSLDNMPGLQFD